jgi:hypothetical protein
VAVRTSLRQCLFWLSAFLLASPATDFVTMPLLMSALAGT